MKRSALLGLAAAGTVLLVTGCGTFSRFGSKEFEYREARDEAPLEVPADLDAPNQSGALVVPPVAADATATNIEPVPPALADPGGAISSGVLGEPLELALSAGDAWERLEPALLALGDVKIVDRDESTRVLTVETHGERPSEAGWFKRTVTLGRAGRARQVPVSLRVRVLARMGDASAVRIEGGGGSAASGAASRLLEGLRTRLGGADH